MIEASSPKARHFAKHVLLVAKKQKEKKQAREALTKHVKKVKRMTKAKSLKKADLAKALEELEQRVDEVLEKEGTLLVTAKKETEATQGVKSELSKVEERLNEISKRDEEVIETLRSKIRELEQELRGSERVRTMQTMENKQRLTGISSMIIDLRSRLTEMLRIKTSHDKRVEELEKKIKHKVSRNFQEMVKLEQHLNAMEEKYELMKKEGRYDKTMLEEVEDKIAELRKRLFLKKAGIEPPEEKVPVPKVKKIFFKKVKTKQEPIIRHELKMETSAEKPEKMEFGEIPSLPPEHKVELLQEPPKKPLLERIKEVLKKK